MATPDYRSYTYNYRAQRFARTSYPFDSERGKQWAAFATTPGILSDTGEQVELTADNKLVVQLFDKDHDRGFYVDDVIMLGKRMLASAQQDDYRKAALRHLEAALFMLDKRVMEKGHAYGESPEEAATPPPASMMMDIGEFNELHGNPLDAQL